MAHYQLKFTLQAPGIPATVTVPAYDPAQDPLRTVADVMKQSLEVTMHPPRINYGPYQESGLTLNKEAEITAQSFQELARVMGQFDELADQVQCSNPVENS